jgi:hypothetical protein
MSKSNSPKENNNSKSQPSIINFIRSNPFFKPSNNIPEKSLPKNNATSLFPQNSNVNPGIFTNANPGLVGSNVSNPSIFPMNNKVCSNQIQQSQNYPKSLNLTGNPFMKKSQQGLFGSNIDVPSHPIKNNHSHNQGIFNLTNNANSNIFFSHNLPNSNLLFSHPPILKNKNTNPLLNPFMNGSLFDKQSSNIPDSDDEKIKTRDELLAEFHEKDIIQEIEFKCNPRL